LSSSSTRSTTASPRARRPGIGIVQRTGIVCIRTRENSVGTGSGLAGTTAWVGDGRRLVGSGRCTMGERSSPRKGTGRSGGYGTASIRICSRENPIRTNARFTRTRRTEWNAGRLVSSDGRTVIYWRTIEGTVGSGANRTAEISIRTRENSVGTNTRFTGTRRAEWNTRCLIGGHR
jgi:hypothetical protein